MSTIEDCNSDFFSNVSIAVDVRDRAAVARPSSAFGFRVQKAVVTNTKDRNDRPAEDSDVPYLSPAKLRAITGFDNLEKVTTLEMKVNTSQNSLGDFGLSLPNLVHLKLSNSTIPALRDIGASLKHLKILWINRCGMVDIDGLSAYTELKELYLAFNSISDITIISMMDQLEVIDLESNNISDYHQVFFLSMCPKLQVLTLEGNPISSSHTPAKNQPPGSSYREAVWKAIPCLQVLDGVPVNAELNSHISSLRSTLLSTSSAGLRDDWLLVSEGIKQRGPVAGPMATSSEASTSHSQLVTSHSSLGWPSQSPMDSTTLEKEKDGRPDVNQDCHDGSELTHGMGQVFCGNPSIALRSRRSKIPVAAQESTLETHELYSSKDEVFAELKQWQRDYDRLAQALTEQAEISSEQSAIQSSGLKKSKKATTTPSVISTFSAGTAARQHHHLPVSTGPDSITELSERVASRPVPPRPHSAADFRRRRYRVALKTDSSPVPQQINEEITAETEISVRPCSVPFQPHPPSRAVPHPPSQSPGTRQNQNRYQRRVRPLTARPDIQQHGHTQPIT